MPERAASHPDQPNLEGPRPARVEEKEPLLAMINYVFRTSLGRTPTIASDWPHVYAAENLGNVNVICDPQRQPDPASVGGTLVASTGVWACDVVIGDVRLRVGGINCVGTLPEYRRHGLGSQVMAAAHQTMRDLGCQVGLLSTGITGWYRRLGWESAGLVRGYRLNRGNVHLLPVLPDGVRMRRVELATDDAVPEAVVDAILRLRQVAQLGALRTPAGLRQLLAARRISHVALAEGANGAEAYVLLAEHGIVEWAGEEAVVLGLVRALFDALDDPSLSTSTRNHDGSPISLRTLLLHTPGPVGRWQPPLVAWLDERGIPCSNDYRGMLYLVDPQGVLDAYAVEDVTLTAAGERFTLAAGKERIEVDRSRLTKLFFGPERWWPATTQRQREERFPLPFWQWYLEIV